MRAKSDITATLASRLTSDIWKKLKNSLLGRELIALGGEIISENDNIKETLFLQLNPETADESGLYMLAQMNEVPVTAKKPTSLMVEMDSNSRTYAPFELKHNIGNQTFYNIEYTMPKKNVSLINGTPKWNKNSNDTYTRYEVSERNLYDNGSFYTVYNIGNAYPDSIVVINDDNNIEVQRYSSDMALSENVGLMYKVITDPDGTQNIRFILGKELNENDELVDVPMPESFTVKWLDHSAGEAEFDEDNKDIKDGNTTIATILYLSEGAEDDLDFMRKQLKKEMAKYDGLNTPKSIEAYVNSKPYVIDCKCAFDEQGRICVYVKPAQDVDLGIYLDYSELAAHISLNSLLFPNIKVVSGKRLLFGMTVSGLKEQAIQDYARNVIQEKYAYDKLKFSSAVNTSEIVADVYGRYGVAPSVTMTLRENFTVDEQLAYVPEKNSIKGFGIDGETTMTEIDGVLYSTLKTHDIMNMFDVVCCVGNMVLFRKYRDYAKRADGLSYPSSEYYYINSSTDINKYGADGEYSSQVLSPISTQYTQLDDFYLWDASSNTIKPFDDYIESLLSKGNYDWFEFGKDAWRSFNTGYHIVDDNRVNSTYSLRNLAQYGDVFNGFAAMQGVEVLSTNGIIVLNFIMNCDGSAYYSDIINNTSEIVKRFKWVNAYSNEHKIEYNKHYQIAFCVSNNIFRNILSESWGEVKAIFDGDVRTIDNVEVRGTTNDGLDGFYDGFKNYKTVGDSFYYTNIKASSFYFEGALYYLKQIANGFVELANNVNNVTITIPLVSTLKGMIEQNGVLYLVQKNNITIVEGFSGIKQKNMTYTIYNGNDLFVVNDIVVGLNGIIMIKSEDGFYMTRKITVRDSVSVIFEDLEKLFIDKADAVNYTIGSCTFEYATCYKKMRNKPDETENGETADSSLSFYCYNIKNKTTQEYYSDNTTTRFYHDYDSVIANESQTYEIISSSTETNIGGEIQEIGLMDYENSKIIVNGNADLSSIATIQYNGVISNNKVDSYIVLNEDDIKFI